MEKSGGAVKRCGMVRNHVSVGFLRYNSRAFDFYESFGMQSGTNAFSYYGNTPLTSALLGIRYKMTDIAVENDPQLEYVTGKDSIFLYRSKYCLPLGFMVNETTQSEVNLTEQNPFVVQNDFVDAAKRAAPIFKIEDNLEGAVISYTAKESGRLYFYIGQKLKNLTVQRMNGAVPGRSNTFTALECAMIIDAGEVRAGDELKLTTSDEGVTSFVVTPAMLDQTALEDALTALGKNRMKLKLSETYVKGKVNAGKDGMLFTTIPYDRVGMFMWMATKQRHMTFTKRSFKCL